MKKLQMVIGFCAVTGFGALALAHPGKGGMSGMKKMDANADGKVTLDEARATAKKRFDRLDANKNGVISKEEMKGRARRLKRADANNDGQVTAVEAQAKLDGWFKRIDKNNDKVLTEDELRAGRGKKGSHHGKQARSAEKGDSRTDA